MKDIAMKSNLITLTVLLLTPLLCMADAVNLAERAENKPLETLGLSNQAGLRWEFLRTKAGWSLGGISFHGKPVEQPATSGLLALRNLKSGELHWMAASKMEKIDPQTARISGQDAIDGVTLSYTVDITLCADMAAARFTAAWSVDKDLPGWEVCLAYHDTFNNDWRVQSYPWAGNSEKVAITPMRYCGVPGVLVYRPDQSLEQIRFLTSAL